MELTLETRDGNTVAMDGLFESAASLRYPYDTCKPVAPVLRLLPDDFATKVSAVANHPDVDAWRKRMLLQTKGAGALTDNKEAYRITWNHETWFVLFHDGRVTLSQKAHLI